MSNQYRGKVFENADGTFTVEGYDGEDFVFKTTPIPPKFKFLAQVIANSMTMAGAFGFFDQTRHQE
jgi:hypothetical protein